MRAALSPAPASTPTPDCGADGQPTRVMDVVLGPGLLVRLYLKITPASPSTNRVGSPFRTAADCTSDLEPAESTGAEGDSLDREPGEERSSGHAPTIGARKVPAVTRHYVGEAEVSRKVFDAILSGWVRSGIEHELHLTTRLGGSA